jgi:hypothetical protein
MGPVENRRMAFLPDGKRLAFLSDRHGSIELFSINTDGGGLQRFTTDAGTSSPLAECVRSLPYLSLIAAIADRWRKREHRRDRWRGLRSSRRYSLSRR